MNYGNMLTRAWNIIWEHKFLILLGVIVALGSASGGSPGGSGAQYDVEPGDFRLPQPGPGPDVPEVLIIIGVLIVVSLAVVVALAFWVAATISRGGLIAAVNAIDGGRTSSFSQAWQAGWSKGWRLLGIGLLPAIPGFILVISVLVGGGMVAGVYGLAGGRTAVPPGIGLVALFLLLACLLVPIVLILSLLQTFANRACMIEDTGVIESYRRGLSVLVENLGQAIVLFLIQIAISIVLGAIVLVPAPFMLICCILWPVLLAVKGAAASYFSTLWTLAWREWTGRGHESALTADLGTAPTATT